MTTEAATIEKEAPKRIRVSELKMQDNFFAPLENSKPYVKAAFDGFGGSGKTHTAANLAIGLYKRIGSNKPIVLFDTENSSPFLVPLFKKNGIQAVNRKSRTLADLKETMRRCREGFSDILLIDSITHVWEDVKSSYLNQKKRQTMQIQDWGVLNPFWMNEFSTPFVHDPYHIIFTGRAAFDYGTEINEENGKREFFKSGVKMNGGKDIAYEPDFSILMERIEEVLGKTKKVERMATILKDRSRLLDGKTFINPSYSDFEPYIEYLLQDVKNTPQSAVLRTEDMIRLDDDRQRYAKDRTILIEKIDAALMSLYPSRSDEDKKARTELVEKYFKTTSRTEMVEKMKLEELKIGLDNLLKEAA